MVRLQGAEVKKRSAVQKKRECRREVKRCVHEGFGVEQGFRYDV